MAARAVLLYDSDCGFCRWSVDRILRWDRNGKIRAVALQEPEAERLLEGFTEDAKMRSWHLALPEGRVCSGGAVAAPLLRLLPGGLPLAVAAGVFPSVTERVYRLVSGNRSRLGRLVNAACDVAARRRRS